jgi:hypothetical protein
MNKDQRKYLVEQVNINTNAQISKLRDSKPARPSLNNYLVAAFLDGSIQFGDMEVLKQKMRDEVVRYGTKNRLVSEEYDEDAWGSRRNRKEGKNVVQIKAEDLFVIPEAYLVALQEYLDETKRIDKQIEQLEAAQKTVVLKLQIGSDKVLSKLIEQADNLADINILNNHLAISAGNQNLLSDE